MAWLGKQNNFPGTLPQRGAWANEKHNKTQIMKIPNGNTTTVHAFHHPAFGRLGLLLKDDELWFVAEAEAGCPETRNMVKRLRAHELEAFKRAALPSDSSEEAADDQEGKPKPYTIQLLETAMTQLALENARKTPRKGSTSIPGQDLKLVEL
jgi:hypothetical protein